MVNLAVNFLRSVTIAKLWRPEVARRGNFVSNFCILGGTTPYGKIFKIQFQRFTWRHRLTLLCSNVIKFVRRKICENVRYLPDKKNFDSLSNFLYCADRAQNLPRPSPYIWLTLFQVSSKLIHFRRSYSRTRKGCSFAPSSICMIGSSSL